MGGCKCIFRTPTALSSITNLVNSPLVLRWSEKPKSIAMSPPPHQHITTPPPVSQAAHSRPPTSRRLSAWPGEAWPGAAAVVC